MQSRALDKKTFGIKNQLWIAFCAAVNISFSLCPVVIFFVELWSIEANSEVNILFVLHFVCFMIWNWFSGIQLDVPDDVVFPTKKLFNFMCFSTTISILASIFNPFFAEFRRTGVLIHKSTYSRYFLASQVVFVPIELTSSVFATWILWKMKRIEWNQEPCKVIYGGEDSSTKKMNLDDSE